jgi:putative intracellular protease/amidase
MLRIWIIPCKIVQFLSLNGHFIENTMKQFSFATLLVTALLIGSPLTSHAADAKSGSVTSLLNTAKAKDVYICPMAEEHPQEFSKPGKCPLCEMELINKTTQLKVAVLVFNEAEEIDYVGPIEVFGAAGAKVFTVGPSSAVIRSANGLKVQPDFDLEHAPEADIFVVPGGGIGTVANNPKLMALVKQRIAETRIVLSVCNGAFILGRLGLLDGISSTSTAPNLSKLAIQFPNTQVVADRRFVDAGKIITTGGLSAGIDGALHVVEREQGALFAEEVARAIEYEWHPAGKSIFGLLAIRKMPRLEKFLPEDAAWQKSTDTGDSERWMTSGHLHLAMSAETFLVDSGKKITEEGWILQKSAPLSRRFLKNEAGQSWTLNLTLTNNAEPSSFDMRVSIHKSKAIKKMSKKS